MKPRGIRIQVTLSEPERVALHEETKRILGAMQAGHTPGLRQMEGTPMSARTPDIPPTTRADPAPDASLSPTGVTGRGRFLEAELDRLRGRIPLDRWHAFKAAVTAHPALQLLGIVCSATTPATICVRGLDAAGRSTRYALAEDAVAAHTWPELEAVLTGRRPPQVLRHMTRIVGYFSELRNWNRSKRAELADRRRGAYALAETEIMPRPATGDRA